MALTESTNKTAKEHNLKQKQKQNFDCILSSHCLVGDW